MAADNFLSVEFGSHKDFWVIFKTWLLSTEFSKCKTNKLSQFFFFFFSTHIRQTTLSKFKIFGGDSSCV